MNGKVVRKVDLTEQLQESEAGADLSRKRHVTSWLFWVCVAWVCSTNVFYCVTLDCEALVNWIYATFPGWLGFLQIAFGFVIVPIVIGKGLWGFSLRLRSPRRFGVLSGLATGLWMNSMFIGVHPLGYLPNILTDTVMRLTINDYLNREHSDLALMVTNMFIYPIVGYFICIRAPACLLPGHCRRCAYDLTGNVSGVCPECGCPTQ